MELGAYSGLAQTIDKINDAFQNYVQNGKVHTLYGNKLGQQNLDHKQYPFESVAYSTNTNCYRPAKHKGYQIIYVNGYHIPLAGPTPNHIHYIDNRHGFNWVEICYKSEMHVLHEIGRTRVLPKKLPGVGSIINSSPSITASQKASDEKLKQSLVHELGTFISPPN